MGSQGGVDGDGNCVGACFSVATRCVGGRWTGRVVVPVADGASRGLFLVVYTYLRAVLLSAACGKTSALWCAGARSRRYPGRGGGAYVYGGASLEAGVASARAPGGAVAKVDVYLLRPVLMITARS